MSTIRSTKATHQRVKNIRRTLEMLVGHELDTNELVARMGLTRSCIRDYIDNGIQAGAIKIVGYLGPALRNQYILTAISQEAIDAMISRITPTAPLPINPKVRKVCQTRDQRLAIALAAGRRIVNHGDPLEHLRIPNAKPAFRCEFETYFFGPARAAS